MDTSAYGVARVREVLDEPPLLERALLWYQPKWQRDEWANQSFKLLGRERPCIAARSKLLGYIRGNECGVGQQQRVIWMDDRDCGCVLNANVETVAYAVHNMAPRIEDAHLGRQLLNAIRTERRDNLPQIRLRLQRGKRQLHAHHYRCCTSARAGRGRTSIVRWRTQDSRSCRLMCRGRSGSCWTG
jgi:hypothetical protein